MKLTKIYLYLSLIVSLLSADLFGQSFYYGGTASNPAIIQYHDLVREITSNYSKDFKFVFYLGTNTTGTPLAVGYQLKGPVWQRFSDFGSTFTYNTTYSVLIYEGDYSTNTWTQLSGSNSFQLKYKGKLRHYECGSSVVPYDRVVLPDYTTYNNYQRFRYHFSLNGNNLGYLEWHPQSGQYVRYHEELKNATNDSLNGNHLSFNTNYKVVVEAQAWDNTWDMSSNHCNFTLRYTGTIRTNHQCNNPHVQFPGAIWSSTLVGAGYQNSFKALRYHIYDFYTNTYLGYIHANVPVNNPWARWNQKTHLNNYLSINGKYNVLVSAQDQNNNWDDNGVKCMVAFLGCTTLNTQSTSITDKQCNTLGAINISSTGGNPNYTYTWSNGATTQNISNLQAGTYTVTTTDTKGCTQIDTFMVADLGGAASLSAAFNVTLTANGSGSAFLWTNDLNSTQHTSQTISVPANGAKWTVYVTDSVCGNDTICYLTPDLSGWDGSCSGQAIIINNSNNSTTGINQLQKEGGLEFYPNPTSSIVNIQSENNIQETIIFDLNGRAILTSNQSNTSNIELNVQNLESGTYILYIKTDSETFKKKLIIE